MRKMIPHTGVFDEELQKIKDTLDAGDFDTTIDSIIQEIERLRLDC